MKDNSCGNCRHAKPDGNALRCYRYPPQVSVIPIQSANAIGQPTLNLQTISQHPVVKPETGCGEWAPGNLLVLS